MRIVLQRVNRASVRVEGQVVGSIEQGLVLLLGVHRADSGSPETCAALARKCADLRIFRDLEGKMNISARQQGLGALVISQFTLFGDCRKGTRPNFMEAAPAEIARTAYEEFLTALRRELPRVEAGIFGAMMEVELVNDGPVTIIIDG